MTKDEALRVALEALEDVSSFQNSVIGDSTEVDKAIAAIREALAEQPAQQQEPVAVVAGYYGGRCVITPTNPTMLFNPGTALYTSPQPAQQQKPVAWVSRTGHGTYFRESITPALEALEFGGNKLWKPLYECPPQRKPWVGLTQDEIISIAYDDDTSRGPVAFARAIEAKLKEKNT